MLLHRLQLRSLYIPMMRLAVLPRLHHLQMNLLYIQTLLLAVQLPLLQQR